MTTPAASHVRPESAIANVVVEHRRLLTAFEAHAKRPTRELLDDVQLFVHGVADSGALLSRESDRRVAQSIVDYWTAALDRAGSEQADLLLLDFDPDRAPTLPDSACPYPGLQAFNTDQADQFFGRHQAVNTLLAQLEQRRFVALVGAAGTGKTSLIRAGLVPALNALPSAPPLEIVDQFEELYIQPDGRIGLSDAAAARIAELVARAQGPGEQRVLIVLRSDFQRYIALTPDLALLFEEGRTVLQAPCAIELREMIDQPAERAGLMFDDGIVEDLVRCLVAEDAPLPLLQFSLLKLWARRVRNRVTWSAYRSLTADPDTALQREGGPRQLMARAADDLYYNDFSPEEQETARWILLRLARPSEGSRIIRYRVARAFLRQQRPNDPRLDGVLNRLIDAHLVRQTDGAQRQEQLVELAHEALVRDWPLLADWLGAERERLRDRIHLAAAAVAWRQRRKDRGALWRGRPLTQARSFTDLSPLERDFVAASRRAELVTTVVVYGAIALAVVSLAAALIFKYRFLEEQSRVATSRGFAAQAQALAGAGNLRLALLLGVEGYAVWPTPEARAFLLREAVEHPALSRFLSPTAPTELAAISFRPDGSTLVGADRDGQVSTWNVDALNKPIGTTLGLRDAAALMAFDPAGDRLAVVDTAGLMSVWDTARGERIQADVNLMSDAENPARADEVGLLTNLAVSGGNWVAVSSADRVSVWNPELGTQVIRVAEGGDDVASLALSGDARTIAWSYQCAAAAACTRSDSDIHVRTIAEPGSDRRLPMAGGPGTINTLALSADGSLLAANSSDRGAVVWDVARQTIRATLPTRGHVVSLTFSRDGGLLASGDDQGRVDVWDTRGGARVGPTLDIQSTQPVIGLAFNRDATRLASAYRTAGQPVVIWDIARQREEPAGAMWSGPVPAALSLRSSNGRWDAAGSCAQLSRPSPLLGRTAPQCTAGQIVLTDTTSGNQVTLVGHSDAITGLAYSPDSTVLASAAADGTVMLWDAATGQSLGPAFNGPRTQRDLGVTFDETGRLVVGSASLPASVTSNPVLTWRFDISVDEFDAKIRPRLCQLIGRDFDPGEQTRFHLENSPDPCEAAHA